MDEILPMRGEGLVAFAIKHLVTKKNDTVVEQGLANVGDGGLVEVLADVDIVDLGTNVPERGGPRSDCCAWASSRRHGKPVLPYWLPAGYDLEGRTAIATPTPRNA